MKILKKMKKMKTLNMLNYIHVNILLFILFIAMFPEGYIIGIRRIVVTFILALMVAYSISHDWRTSSLIAIAFTLMMGLLDSNGPFSDYRRFNHYESFDQDSDTKQDSDGVKDVLDSKPYSSSETVDSDNTNFDDEDLDKILDEDEKQSNGENEHLKQAGGLDQLKNLLDQAKKESPYAEYANKNINEYTPAQAQRATHNLIDTVQQLKETMTSMVPLMKAGGNLIKLHKSMGIEEVTKAFK